MHIGYVLDAVGAGLLLLMLQWFARRMAASINQEQAKRCGPLVIGFYAFMAAYFLMSLVLVSFGVYCILGDIPIPWVPRAIYGTIVASIGTPGLFQASAVLRHDPSPLNWANELRGVKARLRYRLGLEKTNKVSNT